jgi:4'-phosphopantetheinyl transferase EntD
MLRSILPAKVTVVEAREDVEETTPFEAEMRIVSGAVAKRRREFVTTRNCAHRALEQLGIEPVAITAGAHGEPRFPAGVIGSLTHCEGFRACAAARAGWLRALGIDAEPNLPLPEGVVADIVGAEERLAIEQLRRLRPAVHWDRLFFSAKEAVYKALFPLTHRLEFRQAQLSIELETQCFNALLDLPDPESPEQPQAVSGSWAADATHVFTAIVVEDEGGGRPRG